MTLVAATAICRQWLPREHPQHWEPGQKCPWHVTSNIDIDCPQHMIDLHDIPMPPATWDLAGAMLEILAQRERHVSVEYVRDCGWSVIVLSAVVPEFYASSLDAILIASAEWIEGQKQ